MEFKHRFSHSSILFLIPFLILLGSCSPNQKTDLPSPIPSDFFATEMDTSPTSLIALDRSTATIPYSNITPSLSVDQVGTVYQPSASSITAEISLTPSPRYRRTPTITPTPLLPEPAIQILSPASLSKVISPIKIVAIAKPGYGNKISIDLIGEDGHAIASQILTFKDLPRLWAPINLELPFAISAVAEYARLQIFTEDQFYRISELRSVNILLQSDGLNKIYPNSILKERCIVNSPAPLEAISGGIIVVEGQFLPFNDQPLIIELINEKGLIIGTGIVAGEKNDEGLYNLFKSEISYQVPTSTSVRLTVRQQDDHVPGDLFVYSQIILLQP